MLVENPYAPSQLPAEAVEIQWPAGGVFRDGTYWVVHRDAALPLMCVKTGKEADGADQAELFCLQANDDTVQAVKKSFWRGPRFHLEVPVCNEWVRRQRWALRTAALICVIGIAVLLSAVMFGAFMPNPSALPPPMRAARFDPIPTAFLVGALGIALIAVGVMIHDAWRPVVQLHFIAGGYLWLAGASKAYLSSLPEWPVPKPTFWQRFFSVGPIVPRAPKSLRA